MEEELRVKLEKEGIIKKELHYDPSDIVDEAPDEVPTTEERTNMNTNPTFEDMNGEQKEQLRAAIRNGIKEDGLELIADPLFTAQQMFILRGGLEMGLTAEELKPIANSDMSVNEMIGRRAGLIGHLSEEQIRRLQQNRTYIEEHVEDQERKMSSVKDTSRQNSKPKFRSKEENRKLYDLMKEKIKITDIAQELGFTVQRVGNTGYYTIKEHDSIRIKPNNSFVRYSNSDQEKGSVIDFAIIYSGKSKHEVLQEFTDRILGDFEHYQEHPEEYQKFKKEISVDAPKELVLPERNPNMHNVYAYLIKTRMIHQDIVQDLVERKQLYQDMKRNCVFVGYDREDKSKPVYASLRGTNTFAQNKFIGDVSGCDYSQGVLFENQSGHLVIVEGAVDALSKMTLLQMQGKDYKAYDYLVLSSSEKYESCISHLQSGQYEHVTIATDNDEAGWRTAIKIQDIIQEYGIPVEVHLGVSQIGKDWNDELKHVIMKGYRMDYTIPTEPQNKAVAACLENYTKDVLQDKTPRTLAGRQEYLQNKKQERIELLKHYGLPEALDTFIEETGKSFKNRTLDQDAVDKIFDRYNSKSSGRNISKTKTQGKQQIER